MLLQHKQMKAAYHSLLPAGAEVLFLCADGGWDVDKQQAYIEQELLLGPLCSISQFLLFFILG